MANVKARVLATKIDQGQFLAKLAFDKKVPPKGQIVTVRWGEPRSLPQNALYWVYLDWVINTGGLKDQGHFFPECLHENLKQHLLGKGKRATEQSTTDLNKSEFGEYFDKVDKFIQEFFEIDTSPFWEEHRREYGNE